MTHTNQRLHHPMNRRSFLVRVGAGVAATHLGATVLAASRYPQTNLAVGYKVDPTWPKKPAAYKWRYMCGLAVDKQDRVWTLNAVAPCVQVYSASGEFLFAWGKDMFKAPHHILVDHEGNVWITDYQRHTVERFTPQGKRLLTLGTADEAGADGRHFNMPTATAVTPSGEVFVTDGYGNNRIVHFRADGRFVKSWGKLGVRAGELSQPHNIALDSKGRLYVGERNNCRIQIFDQDGKSLAQWRNLANPWGFWFTANDELLVCGSSPKRWSGMGNLGNPPTDQLVMKLNSEGRALELWTFPLAEPGKQIPGQIDWIHGIAADSQGNLYLGDVADNSPSHRAQKFLRLPAEG
jgi:hypothetical protein